MKERVPNRVLIQVPIRVLIRVRKRVQPERGLAWVAGRPPPCPPPAYRWREREGGEPREPLLEGRWIANERRGAIFGKSLAASEKSLSPHIRVVLREKGPARAARGMGFAIFRGKSREKNLRMGLGAQHL